MLRSGPDLQRISKKPRIQEEKVDGSVLEEKEKLIANTTEVTTPNEAASSLQDLSNEPKNSDMPVHLAESTVVDEEKAKDTVVGLSKVNEEVNLLQLWGRAEESFGREKEVSFQQALQNNNGALMNSLRQFFGILEDVRSGNQNGMDATTLQEKYFDQLLTVSGSFLTNYAQFQTVLNVEIASDDENSMPALESESEEDSSAENNNTNKRRL